MKAVDLFIQEEQKHGENLGKYLDAIGEARVKSDFGDSLFRSVRYFNTSMELWTITVIIVESAAQVFYQSLHDATGCDLLKEICVDILKDEAHHIKFCIMYFIAGQPIFSSVLKCLRRLCKPQS